MAPTSLLLEGHTFRNRVLLVFLVCLHGCQSSKHGSGTYSVPWIHGMVNFHFCLLEQIEGASVFGCPKCFT